MNHKHPEESIESLRERVALSSNFGWLVVSAVTAILYREKGEQALNDVWRSLMSAEQTIRFRDALVKLGIENDPPAVAAAKYHYFSNSIGGLTMHFIEESPKKAWIRYMPPWGSFPGIAAMAVPSSVRRTILSTWHPRNGELIGLPAAALGRNQVHRRRQSLRRGLLRGMRPGPGAFGKDDHPGGRRKSRVDPDTAPKLDPKVWPEARILKGSHNYAADYALHAIEAVIRLFGEQQAQNIVRMAMKFLAVQYTGSLAKQAGAPGERQRTPLRRCRRPSCARSAMMSSSPGVGHGHRTELQDIRSLRSPSPPQYAVLRVSAFDGYLASSSGRFTGPPFVRCLDRLGNLAFSEDHQRWMQ